MKLEDWRLRPVLSWTYAVDSVYFAVVGEGRVVKIGYAKDVAARIRYLQVGNHEELIVVKLVSGTKATEAEFHRRFGALRIRGEWFRVEGSLAEFLALDRHEPDGPCDRPEARSCARHGSRSRMREWRIRAIDRALDGPRCSYRNGARVYPPDAREVARSIDEFLARRAARLAKRSAP
jgi:hypothetical protein